MARKVPGVRLVNGKWYADAYDPQTGKKTRVRNPKTGKTAFDSQSDAVLAKEAFEQTKRSTRERAWTVDQWVEEWCTNPGYARPKKSTNLHYHYQVRKFAEDFVGRPLISIDRPTARKWAVENPSRINEVRAMLADAVQDGAIPVNPFANLKIPALSRKGRRDITPLTETEVLRLIQTADDMYPDWPAMGASIAFCAYTGARLSEMFGVQWADIDWEAQTVHIQRQWSSRTKEITTTKSGQDRRSVIYPVALERLRELPKIGEDGTIFYTRRDQRPFTQQNHGHYWRQVRARFHGTLTADRAQKIPSDFDWHELRHFHGSWLADHGATAQDIAQQLGHQDGGRLAMQLYIHTYEENALARLRRIGLPRDDDQAQTG